ncbi:hypothetical protein NDN94_28980, partial [Burkholderia glumae]|uniref:hypothetical protein n=1 Tax=Burkholderia glumae TaxID=337 RepID=UPI0020373DE6
SALNAMPIIRANGIETTVPSYTIANLDHPKPYQQASMISHANTPASHSVTVGRGKPETHKQKNGLP